MRLVLATGNRDKVSELSQLLSGVEIGHAPDGFDPDETGDTLYQNALIKAEALRAMPEGRDALILADDSGLLVHALGGRPGVYSARYAGPTATYADNCNLLLEELTGTRDRRAVFACTLVALAPDGRRFVGVGVCPGEITGNPRGDGGFGYDPVFQPSGGCLTMAQMAPDEKHRISHRGRAGRRISNLLRSAGLV